jgi:hypothetical protein
VAVSRTVERITGVELKKTAFDPNWIGAARQNGTVVTIVDEDAGAKIDTA